MNEVALGEIQELSFRYMNFDTTITHLNGDGRRSIWMSISGC